MKKEIEANQPASALEHEFDIAIVGMSCRLPGAQNLEEFWQNLADGVESIARLSDKEMLQSGVPRSVFESPNYVKAAAILEEPALFDAAFFGFSPMEAKSMDPQHRLLLELAHEALENAGCDPDRYPGRIGVFTGAAMNTYFMNNGLSSRFAEDYIPTLIVNDKDYLSTRISYKLNLKGPSITIQTACSTSLVAVHLARQSLLSEETDMALAGAISVRVPHRAGYFYDHGGVVSPDGHVRAFDAKANGTVFGSGGGIIVLKRWADAIAGGDTIYAVIKGSAVNNDGSEKAGYTAPSVNSQADAVVEAMANAGIDAESVSYIEAHGSGTSVGDPIEIMALTKAFRTFTQRSGYCAIGSVKTNVGHLDAAAGIAGIIKTALALERRQLPPSLHYDEPNPEIDFASTPFYVNTHLSSWTSDGPRRAGVMSTGMGGTNAHVILEEAPAAAEATASSGLPHLLVLSAKNATALDAATNRLLDFLKSAPTLNMEDVAYTLQTGRKVFPHRRILLCADREDAIAALGQEESKRVISSQADESTHRPLIFLLPGIGDHYVGMARELYEKWDVFKQEVDRCAKLLQPHLGVDIRSIIYPKGAVRKTKAEGIDLKKMLGRKTDESTDPATQKLNQTIYAQPALFTVEYSLARLWQHLGITPDAIVGHSMGEYVAACLADVLSLNDALQLIAARARLVNELPRGSMLAVMLSESELLPLLTGQLSISLINGPDLCVVAGPAAAMSEFEKTLNEKGVVSRPVQNAHAFHSRMLDPIVPAFTQELSKVQLREPKIPFISNVTGRWITKAEATDPAYWAKHVNHTARFSAALRDMWQLKEAVLLEVGPGSTLSVLAMQHPERKNAGNPVAIPSLRANYENKSDVESTLQSIGRLWLSGVRIDWSHLHDKGKRRIIPLPTYPFERQKYWIESRGKLGSVARAASNGLADSSIDNWFYVPSWERSDFPGSTEENARRIASHSWLIFGGDGAWGAKLSDFIKQAGGTATLVYLGHKYDEGADGSCEIDAAAPDDYIRLIEKHRPLFDRPVNIVHLGSLTSVESKANNRQPEQHLASGFYSLLFLAQSIGELGLTLPIRIGVVSNGMHQVLGDEEICPEKATVLGPCGVIPKEYPNVSCFSVDLTEASSTAPPTDGLCAQLVSEFGEQNREDITAYRGKYRWTKTYRQVALQEGLSGNRLRKNGVYLITGGTGGIGLEVGKYLAGEFQAKLVLTKKREFPARARWQECLKTNEIDESTVSEIKELLEIERLGGEVEVHVSDAADKETMRAIVAHTISRFGALHGVIHAAGIVRAGLIQVKSKEMAANVLSPKVQGTLVLHELLRDVRLDFLVLFSSITSVVTPYAESDYAGANAFLDAFAGVSSNERSYHTVAINWPGWRETGQLVKLKPMAGVEWWKEEALRRGILNRDGLTIFKRALSADVAQVIVSPEDLESVLAWANEPIEVSDHSSSNGNRPAANHPERKRNCQLDVPRNETEETVARIWRNVLGVSELGIHEKFTELGGHSLLAIRILADLRKAFELDLSMRALFDAPSVAELAANIENRIAAEIQTLSDEEVRAEIGKG